MLKLIQATRGIPLGMPLVLITLCFFTKLHGLYELIFYITKYPMVGFILS